MEQYVLKSLKRLRKEAPKRYKDLRDSCDDLIAALTEKERVNGASSGVDGPECDADQYFEPLELACETKQPKLMEMSLDTLHFLIEHGYLKGKSKVNVSLPNSAESDGVDKTVQRPLIDIVIETVTKCSDEFDDAVQLQVIKVLLTAITSLHCEVHESSLLLAVRACFHIHLISKNPVNKTTAKAALTQMLSVVNQRMEMADARLTSEGRAVAAGEPTQEAAEGDAASDKNAVNNITFASLYHKDCYLLFRALCKLSMKGLSDDSSNGAQNDAIALQNKILSLELILNILLNSGPAFRSGDKFIYAIRQYLCVSLLTNCTSQVAQITGLALQIFVVVMQNFKDHLKSELEVFVSTIFLRILESENSTYDHKCRVLEVFQNICKDSSALIELFINYDCDLEAINLFSRFVAGFAKIAKNPSISQASRVNVDFITNNSKKLLSEESHLRTLGLEGLIIIIKSLEVSSGFAKKSTDKSADNSGKKPEDNSTEDETPSEASEPPATLNIVDVFDKKQKMQEEIETGILKFNLSAKKGLAYLASKGHIELTPVGVAEFFRQYQDRLDKTAVGDYLGREREYENGFCLKVLHEYVQGMDFENMAFDLAIRYFLNGFRLPGEAQKIDRLMEKFAERYYLQNRDTFISADMCFILAFSTIMLQTNLHNPAIREDKRMTKEQFLKQNKGISADGELPETMLMEIYDRIAAEPISITSEDKTAKKAKKEEASSSIFQPSADKKKKDAFNNERKEMVRAGEAMIKLNSKRGSVFVRNSAVSEDAYVRPMFDIVWPPVLGVLSMILETYDDPQMVQLCISGFQTCIELSCRLDVNVARNTFINALSKFTTLDSVRDMREKNVLSVKLLLSIALTEGDYLGESWTQVLQNVSHLARLQLLASGSHTDDMFFSESSSHSSTTGDFGRTLRRMTARAAPADKNNMDPFTKLFMGPSKAETARITEETNAELLMKEIDPVLIDKIYLNSVHLTGDSVAYFVGSLCEVSLLEISTSSRMNSLRGKDTVSDASTPRIFSMQKLVEVADFNMHSRSRMDWARIWKYLAHHFSNVGQHENQAVALYAIDSLKQLSIKFLQKDELSNFNFQRLFLKPFEMIIAKSKNAMIKDLVLRCIDIMIKACANNIHSGWRSIFVIFEVVAGQPDLEIATIAFDIIEQLIGKQFHLLTKDFVELVNCLMSFVASIHSALSSKALAFLATCADHLASGRVSTSVDHNPGAATSVDSVVSTEDSHVFRLWWPLLLGLSTSIADPRLHIRVKALETLRLVLLSNGCIFTAQTWSVVYKGILFPIVDSAKTDSTVQPRSAWPTERPLMSQNKQSWIGTMGMTVLGLFVELYKFFRAKCDEVNVLPELFGVLEECILQDTESLAVIGLRVFSELAIFLSQEASAQKGTDDLVCSVINKLMLRNVCLDFGDFGAIKFDTFDISQSICRHLERCPLAQRRVIKDLLVTPGNSQQLIKGSPITTAYGTASFDKSLASVQALDLPERMKLVLPWGVLYASSVTTANNETASSEVQIQQTWPQFSASAMTTMVIALEFISLVGSLQCDSWQWVHWESVLSSLEAYYWHACGFNTNIPLRLKLQQKGFMNRSRSMTNLSSSLPDLLPQEVGAIEQILRISFKLYLSKSSGALEAAVHPWIERFSSFAFYNYLQFEEELLSKGDGDSSDEESADDNVLRLDAFSEEKHHGYKAPVLMVLKFILQFSPHQFQLNVNWIAPFLCRLIVCESQHIRLSVREVYRTFVNPLILK